MISRRLPASFDPNPLARELEARRLGGRTWLDLTVSNPTRCGFPYPGEAIRGALADPAVLSYDPDARGPAAAREAVAAYHGHGLDASRVVLAASTSEAYAWLFKLLCDPGDDVLVPSPSYPLFHWLAALEGIEARPVPALPFEDWDLDLPGLEASLTPRTRAVVVVNPNNPTGRFLSRTRWAGLLEFCAARGLAVLVDEVFRDYALEPDPDALATALETPEPPCPVFLLSGLSKIAALPQVKLGWIALLGPAKDHSEALAFLADQYLSVSASAQAACGTLLALAPAIREPILSRLRGNLAALDALLRAHPSVTRHPVQGGWSVILRCPVLDPDRDLALDLLKEKDVLLHPGRFFDLPGEGRLVASLLPEAFPGGMARALAHLDPRPWISGT
jgi:hypothetical protein